VKDERDIELARKGSKDAFIRLIIENEKSMYRIARSILKSDSQCADAIQEAILKAFKYIHSLKDTAYFKTWLIRILINECRSILKFQKNVVPLDSISEQSARERGYERLEIIDAIESLDESLRTIITLYYFEDLQVKEISELLLIPEGTVKSRLHRARVHLAESLGIHMERSTVHE
jgi:RNA polymerase sigma-70 factor (ECF subfamily)